MSSAVGGLNPPNSASGLFDCFHEQGEMSRVQREKGVSYSFSDIMMGLITQLQQYQSFLKIRLFARFLYQHSIADVLVLKLGQSQNITLTIYGIKEENNNIYLISTWNGLIGTFQWQRIRLICI
jgi:hypothetical protein